MHIGDYRLAVPHLEKALEYNPNASGVVNMLSSIYSNALPDTGKYLEYALRGIQLDVVDNDTNKSYIYLHLSNALIQSGFTDEALEYIDKAIELFPQNPYAPYLKAYIRYAKNKDIKQALNAIKGSSGRTPPDWTFYRKLPNCTTFRKNMIAHSIITNLSMK